MTINDIIRDYLFDYYTNNIGINSIHEIVNAFEECVNYHSYELALSESVELKLQINHYDNQMSLVAYVIDFILNIDDCKYYITRMDYDSYY